MPPLTDARVDTTERAGNEVNLPVKAAVICYQGGLAVIDAGFAAPGRTAAALIVVGRFEETVDNSAGIAGAKRVQVRRGVFKFANSATDAVTQADLFKDVYIEDDQTIAKTVTGKSKAGRLIEIVSDGVFVDTRY